MNPLVRIGIPLYNTEKYLRKCLDSFINQTLRDIEIVFVDDSSPDRSLYIAREYQAIDDRIVTIRHEKNAGSGEARNSAIKKAKAPYLGAVQ